MKNRKIMANQAIFSQSFLGTNHSVEQHMRSRIVCHCSAYSLAEIFLASPL